MVPSDHQYTNLVVDQNLLVKQSFVSPLVQTTELLVSGSASLQQLTLNGQSINQLISQIISSDIKVPSFDTTNIVSTNITTTNLSAANATLTDTTIVNLSVTDLTGANIIAVNLMVSDVKTTTLSATTLSSGSALLTDLVNQLVLGVGNTLTLNAPAPAASHIYSLPDVLADASFVMTEGAQTINGIKTFSDTVVFISGFSLASLTLTAVSNQLTLGAGNTITLNAPTPAASRIYTAPDVLANANFILSEGAQTINGVKTFNDTVVFISGFSLASLTLTAVSNQLTLGTGNTITLNAPTPAASRTYTAPDVLANANFILSEGTQTINGLKTFSAAISDTALTNQLILGSATTITINAPAPAASRVYTTPDVLGNADFVLTAGTQTISGAKTFSLAISDTALTNQLVLGGATTITINAPAPAASRVYTTPDVLGNADFVLTAGTQTIGGAKTFSLAISDTALTNQLVLGSATTITINAPAPAASRVYTAPDVLANANFILSEGTQTLNGLKTFSSAITDTATTNQLILSGPTRTVTINAPEPVGASRTHTIPADVGADANFVLSEGTQTINGLKTLGNNTTFNANLVLSTASTITTAKTTNQMTFTNGGNTTTLNVNTAANRTYSLVNVGADGDFVMTSGAQTLDGLKTFNAGAVFGSAAIFNAGFSTTVGSTVSSLTFTDASLQISLGTFPVQIILSAPTPAAGIVYTFEDVGINASVVLSSRSTETQATDITTAVTLNAPSGVITTQTATAASGATQTFTVNNTVCFSTSVVIADLHQYSGTYLTNGIPYVRVTTVADGSFDISVINIHGTNALNGTLVIHFLVC